MPQKMCGTKSFFFLLASLPALSSAQPALPAAPSSGDVSSALLALRFFHSGLALASSNYTLLQQCSGFSECTDVWTCGSPREYLWETTRGNTTSTVQAPPMGLRSAVPLGGVGASTFELRGDGTFADWQVENQGTALAASATQSSKLPVKREAFLGVAFSAPGGGPGSSPTYAAALRTTPPEGIPGVASLNYSGAYPFSRLALVDARAPVDVAVYAYSRYAPAEPAERSALPLAVFSLVLTAPASLPAPLRASFLLSLPLGASLDTRRLLNAGDPRNQTLAVLPTADPGACLDACTARGAECVWWTWEPATPPTPNVTTPDTDCPGGDIYAPPRIAVRTLTECADHCVTNVPNCGGVVFDTLRDEQSGQCSNTDAALSCCLPKTACASLVSKPGDTTWRRGSSGTPAPKCSLFALAPAVEQHVGGSSAYSGVRGVWATDDAAPGAPPSLTLRRSNAYDADPTAAAQDPACASNASFTLLAVDSDAEVTFAAANSLVDGIWAPFAAHGALPAAALPSGVAAAHGAVATTVVLSPGETRSLTLVFAWHLPHRLYVGQELGNQYATFVGAEDALAVARSAAGGLKGIVASGAALNAAFATSSLPLAWVDFFVNSLASQAKMSVWVARDVTGALVPGGRFRMYEAFSGCDLAPVHVNAYALIPLSLAFPELLKNTLLTGWAARQLPNGMVQEYLGAFSAPGGRVTGPMDSSAGGRVMGDVSTVFILATLAVVRADNDTEFLASIFPAIAAAARWQIASTHASTPADNATAGCPRYLQTTYDYLGLNAYPLATYNAVLHLAAMRATVRLAALAGDTSTLARDAAASEMVCAATMRAQLWHEEDAALGVGWWRAVQTLDGTAPDDILSGALHGLSWGAFTGLGPVVPLSNVSAHVAAERARNCAYSPACELGLQALPGSRADWALDASPAQSMDATAASVLAGAGGLTDSVASASIALYRDTHHDLWHWMDLHMGPSGRACGGGGGVLEGEFLAGTPFVNSHYARQLQGWAALIATTGQQHDAPTGVLSFAPTCEGRRSGAGGALEVVLPFLTPGALGTLTVEWTLSAVPTATVRVLSGHLHDAVRVNVDLARCPPPAGWTVSQTGAVRVVVMPGTRRGEGEEVAAGPTSV